MNADANRHTRASTPLAILIVTLLVAVALTVLVTLLWLLLGRGGAKPVKETLPDDSCVAVAGDYSGLMTPEQAGNAAIIVGEAMRRELPARAATIALVAAWQESGLHNLDHGDLDSLGLFQQRPSQGWGTAEEIMDPWYASGKFYDALVKVSGWQADDINDVAQKVQRSGYPDAYGQHEGASRAWASNLTGNTAAGVRCVANTGPGGGGDQLVALLTKVWGDKLVIGQDGPTIQITAPDAQRAWAVAQLSMAQLAAYGLVSVQVGEQFWLHNSTGLAAWQVVAPPDTTPTPDAATATPSAPEPTPTPGLTPLPDLSEKQIVITLR